MNSRKQNSTNAQKELALAKIIQSCKIKTYCGIFLLVMQQIIFFALSYIGDTSDPRKNTDIMYILFFTYYTIIPAFCTFIALSILIQQRNFKQVYHQSLPKPLQTRAIIATVINLMSILSIIIVPALTFIL